MLGILAFTSALIFQSLVSAELSGSVGPLTSYEEKAGNKTCNVLDYGAADDSETDIGPPLQDAWDDCKAGGLVYIPEGTYSMQTWVSLTGGSGVAIQLDGTIFRDGEDGGNMISVDDCDDFEIFSGNSKGAMQGYGYKLISEGEYGARFIRLTNVHDYSMHGIALVDSASYYLVFDSTTNGEIYNLIIRGIKIGMTDGIDIWGENIWVHDVEVTNGDECVTVKSPSKNLLIESIYCNISGGTAIGSLLTDTDIADVTYRNLYMNQADPCYLKTNNGDGTVTGISWDSVIVYGGPYVLAVNEAWGEDRGSTGVEISNLSFTNWRGYNGDNSRPTIRLECDEDVPCYDIFIDDVELWTTDGDFVTWSCQNAYGEGACLQEQSGDELPTYTTEVTVTETPSYTATTMPNDHAEPFPSTESFTIPPLPTTFFPGLEPLSTLLDLDGPGGLGLRAEPTEAS